MIEINLLEQKKPFKLPVTLGVDLATINYKMLILTFLLSYVPGWFLYSDWGAELQEEKAVISGLKAKERALRKKLTGQKDITAKLKAYNKQIEVLKKRSEQVESIIQKRSDIKSPLERLSRDIPNDMWFTGLTIEKNNITIEGSSYSFKSISSLVNKLNSSVFYNRSMEVVDSKTGVVRFFGKNYKIENFKLKGNVNLSSSKASL